MTRRPLLGLTASLLAHGALIAGVALVVPRADRLPALFVDLTQDHPAGERPAPVSRPAKIGAARRPAPSGTLASPAPAIPRVVESPASVEKPPLTPAARASEPEEPPPAPAPPRREEVASAPAAPPAPATTEPAPSLPAIAPPPREELTSAPSAVSAPSAPITSSPVTPPAHPAAVATAWFSSDTASGAPAAPLPDTVGGPSSERSEGDSRGEAVAADAPIHSDAGDGLGARQGQGLALARSGTGADDPAAAYAGYLTGLRHRLQEALRYPLPARRRGLTGTVTIELTVLPSGAIGPVTVVESSAHPLLDQAALETVGSLRAAPFPADLPPRTLRVRLPVVFQLR